MRAVIDYSVDMARNHPLHLMKFRVTAVPDYVKVAVRADLGRLSEPCELELHFMKAR